jgi:hypothetical protein
MSFGSAAISNSGEGDLVLLDDVREVSDDFESRLKSGPAPRSTKQLTLMALALSLGGMSPGICVAAMHPPPAPVEQNAAGTNSSNGAGNQPHALPTEPARSWAVDAVANELLVLNHPGSYLRYKMHVHDEKGDLVRDVIESKDGAVARLILKNGKPLTTAEDQAERDRLNAMIASPGSFARHIKNEESGRKTADDLIRLMSDAMIYTYVPDQPQLANRPELTIVLDYEPNPKFKPPTTLSQGLTGLKGRVWIDAKSRRVVRIEGNIFQAINLGWGMLAHIYPGGKLVLEQTNAAGQRWIYTHFNEQVSVRALMVKTLNVNNDYDASGYEVVPEPISYQDAIKLLLDTPLPRH